MRVTIDLDSYGSYSVTGGQGKLFGICGGSLVRVAFFFHRFTEDRFDFVLPDQNNLLNFSVFMENGWGAFWGRLDLSVKSADGGLIARGKWRDRKRCEVLDANGLLLTSIALKKFHWTRLEREYSVFSPEGVGLGTILTAVGGQRCIIELIDDLPDRDPNLIIAAAFTTMNPANVRA